MYFVNNLLRKIINKDYDFCCICFNTIESDPIHVENDVILIENYVGNNVKIADMLSYVLGNEVFNEFAFDTICQQCSISTMNCYKFIKEVKDNTQQLTIAIDHLSNCFENTTELANYKTLFVSLNSDLCTSNQYYDTISCINTSKAYKRFRTIVDMNTPKIKTDYVKPTKTKSDIKPEVKLVNNSTKNKTNKKGSINGSGKSGIPIKDMLYDKNNPKNLQCKECLKIFTAVENLKNHFIRVHSPKTFKCPECPRSFGSMSILYAHKQESHVTLKCRECGKTFHNRHTLKMHEKGHYMKLVCQDCGRVYKNHNTFKLHLDNNICQSTTRRSQTDAKFTCDYCQKKYTQKMTLRVHIQFEHLNYKYHECKWCPKKFWCQSRLKAHIVKHTRERNFVCTICNGKFVTKESLLYHTRIHTGEKPYPCPHCESRFLSASRKLAHIKSHHMDPTVECDVCHSKFRSYLYLQKHKKIHNKSNNSESTSKTTDNAKLVPDKAETYPVVYFNRSNSRIVKMRPNIKTEDEPNLSLKSNQEAVAADTDVKSNIKLYYEGVSEEKLTNSDLDTQIASHKVLLTNSTNDMKFSYQLNDDDSQQSVNVNEVYLVVSEDDDYVIKVSENVEV